MSQHLVIATAGPDKPGLVRDLTRAITDCDCDVLDSRMSTLGQGFGAHLLVRGNWHAVARLESELDSIADSLGLKLAWHRTEGPRPLQHLLPYVVDVICLDRPGVPG